MAVDDAQIWTQTFLKVDGTPYVGVRLFHYEAGTSIDLDVFDDAGKVTASPQPFVGDSAGRVVLYGDDEYRFDIFASVADGGANLYDWSPVRIMGKAATLRAENMGISLPAASADTRGRQFARVDGGGDVLDFNVQSTASAFLTMLVANLPLSGTIQWGKGTDLASSATLTLSSDGNYWDVTGTNTISAISTKSAGTPILLQFDAVLTLTNNAVNLILSDGLNYTTAAGDVFMFVSEGSGNWREVSRIHIGTPQQVVVGGSGAATLTDGGILLGSGTSPITPTTQPTNGQLVIGSTGVDPAVAALTEGDGVTVTNAAGAITLTNNSFFIASDVITQEVVSTPTETTVFSETIPAGILLTTRGIIFEGIADFLQNSAGTETLRIRFKYGGTTFADVITTAFSQSANRLPLYLHAFISSRSTSGTQYGIGWVHVGDQVGVTANQGIATSLISLHSTLAIDSSSSQVFLVSFTNSLNNANVSSRMHAGHIIKL